MRLGLKLDRQTDRHIWLIGKWWYGTAAIHHPFQPEARGLNSIKPMPKSQTTTDLMSK